MPSVKAGRLRHRLTIQTHTVSQDGFGEPDKTWSDLATVWADVRPLRGREYLEARGEQGALFYLVTMRKYSTPINQFTHRFQFTDADSVTHTLDIDEPPEDVDQRGIMLRVRCREQI